MSKKHRCSAFPQVDIKDSYGMLVPYLQRGMTLRDYFAAKAMEGYVSDKAWRMNEGVDATAISAYKMADAMLKARESDG